MGNPEDRAGLGDEGRHPAHLLSEVLNRNSSKVNVEFTRYAFVGFGFSCQNVVYCELGLGQNVAGKAVGIRSAAMRKVKMRVMKVMIKLRFILRNHSKIMKAN